MALSSALVIYSRLIPCFETHKLSVSAHFGRIFVFGVGAGKLPGAARRHSFRSLGVLPKIRNGEQ